MDVCKIEEKSLQLSTTGVEKTTRKQDILDEDTYIESIEKIIERDYFPEVTKLKAQNQYLEAVDNQDVNKLRMLSSKYQVVQTPLGEPCPSPAMFERPTTQQDWEERDDGPTSSQGNKTSNDLETEQNSSCSNPSTHDSKNVTLDTFLAKHTSEDNESFDKIMDNTLQKNREKHSWLYEKEVEHKMLTEQRLALPEANKEGDQLMIANRPANLDNWEYTNMNALMYVPECATLTVEEALAQQKLQEREIKHINTRLPRDLFDKDETSESVVKAADNQAFLNKGKIGVDGKEIGGNETPNVNGFRFVATPSPAPGVDASPLMTWGTIEGTPFRLDAGDVGMDQTPGPTFKIPEPKKREAIALKLAEKASKRHREERRQAQAASVIGRSPKYRNSSDRLLHMSPAAQRLASERLGIRMGSDKALKSSYSPSPQRPRTNTPGQTPTPSRGTPYTPETSRTPRTPSLTDNLLSLPKQ